MVSCMIKDFLRCPKGESAELDLTRQSMELKWQPPGNIFATYEGGPDSKKIASKRHLWSATIKGTRSSTKGISGTILLRRNKGTTDQ